MILKIVLPIKLGQEVVRIGTWAGVRVEGM
jgi:hypothetical protein